MCEQIVFYVDYFVLRRPALAAVVHGRPVSGRLAVPGTGGTLYKCPKLSALCLALLLS